VKHPDDKQGAPRLPNLTLVDLKARTARLAPLERGFALEVALQREAEDQLLFRERKQYLAAVQDALAGAEAALVALAGVVKRLERD
jgi:hypothetical protein